MSHMKTLSAKLSNFKNTFSPAKGNMQNAKQNIANYTNEAKNAYESAYNGINSTITDNQGKAAASALKLIIQATEVLHNSMENDMGGILSKCEGVEAIIAEIESKIAEGSKLKPASEERVGLIMVYHQNDQARIDQLNKEIESLNAKGENNLNAIAQASNSVKLGIVGNMVSGGTLGSYIDFTSNYKFDPETMQQETATYKTNIFGSVGCFVLGQVEGAVKMVEGVADAALTGVGAVTQVVGAIFLQDWSSNIFTDVAKADLTGFAADKAYGFLDKVRMYDENARNVGLGVGVLVSSAAMMSLPGGLAIVAASTGGQAAESSLANNSGALSSLAKGTLTGGVTYVGGKFLGAAIGKLAGTPIGKSVTSAVNKITSSKAGQLLGKGVGFVTSPASKTSRRLITNNPAMNAASTGAVKVGTAINNSKLGQTIANTQVGKILGFSQIPSASQPSQLPPAPQPAPAPQPTPQPAPAPQPTPPSPTPKITQENSIFKDISDEDWAAYQKRNGL